MSKRTRIWAGLGAALVVLVGTRASGAEPAPDAAAKLQQAMAQEHYLEAGRLADQLLQSGGPEGRQAALSAYGRILLGQNRKARARAYLAAMKRLKQGGISSGLMRVYDAWLDALEGKPDRAVKTLQEVLDRHGKELAAAEAADVLSRIYLKQGEPAKAKETVQAGLDVLDYLGARGAYIETILRGRLKVIEPADPARELFQTAERLRQENKLAEAARSYTQLRSGFPNSPWSHPAGLRLGECLVGPERYADALSCWKAFLKEQPAGPWRGQAHVAVVDLALRQQFNLGVAAEHASLAGAVLDNMKDKEPEKSWQQAALDIRLRQGIVSLLRGEWDAAAAAFQQARPLAAGNATMQAGLDRLSHVARNRLPLNPAELGRGADQPSVTVAVGGIYNLLGQYSRGLAFCQAVVSGGIRGSSRPHRSLAALGTARAYRGLGASDKAIAAFRQSLKEQARASWHDDTLRELGLLIEQTAHVQADAAAKAGKPKPGEDKNKSDKNSRKRSCGCRSASTPSAAQLAKFRAEALPCWTELVASYPESRHVPEALYHAGLLNGETDQWQKAVADFDRLTREHPDSLWAGEGHLHLIDIFLERQFDLAGAQRHAAAAIKWFEQLDLKKAAAAVGEVHNGQSAGARPVAHVGYDVYLRAGLLEYLQERYAEAGAMFQKAQPLAPPRRFTVVRGKIPTGIERLIQVVKAGKPLTPEIVRQGDPNARLILMLADVYYEARQFAQSWCLCDRLIEGSKVPLTRQQRSWALFQRGRSAYQLRTQDPDFIARTCGKDKDRASESVKAALGDYESASLMAPQADWASRALFLAANIQWNFRQDLSSAVSLWRRLLDRYPESPEADRSAYYIAVAYHWADRPQNARRVFREFLRDRPDSRLASGARQHLKALDLAKAPPKPQAQPTTETQR